MLGVITNTLTVIIGSCTGLICKKNISKKLTDAIMLGIGLCTVSIGISGLSEIDNSLILIISVVLGAIVGTLIDIDAKITKTGDYFSEKLKKDEKTSITEGFVTACLLFCVGSMTIVGSLNSGLTGDNSMIFTKSLLDLVSSTMLAASLGVGVLFAAAFVFVFQGILVAAAGFLAPLLTEAAIVHINYAGSLLIFALGLNIIGVTKIKVANYLPAIIFAPIVLYIFNLF